MTTEAEHWEQVRRDLMRKAGIAWGAITGAFIAGCVVGGMLVGAALHDRHATDEPEDDATTDEAREALYEHTERLWEEHEERDAALAPRPRVR